MLPNRNVLDENVDKNFKDLFSDTKLSKKAEAKVRELLTNAVALTFKLKQAIHHHNNITKFHNAMVETFNHKFEYVGEDEEVLTEEITSENENQEVAQESNSPEVSN